MLNTLPRVATLALALTLLCSPASALFTDDPAFSVSPAVGTTGTLLTLTANAGVDFGSKPKVTLIQDGSKKKNTLKTISATATEIVVEIKKVDKKKIGESFHVRVQPKGNGVDPITVENSFTVCDISLMSKGPVELVSELPSELLAACMGAKPAKVKIGKKPAKVTDWDPDSGNGDGGGAIEGSFKITPHKKLANGIYDLEIKTKAGKQVFESAVKITGSTAGFPNKPTFSAKFGKDKVKAKKKLLESLGVIVQEFVGTTHFAMAIVKGKTIYQFPLIIEWVPADGDQVLTAADMPLTALEFIKSKALAGTQDSYHFTNASMNISTNGARVFGTFSGTMAKDQGGTGNGPASIEVSKGQFNLQILD
ncbi:MAG: hypothetical protein DRQ55_08300 [Planctomycetota bacterium]|nr:MAG: hypothetical protein DRQ55_08300 [Planctomycetota bacterium]